MTWVTIPNSVFEAGKPARALDMRNLRDNIASALAGEANAPRLYLPALERLAVGSTIHLRADAMQSAPGITWVTITGFTLDFVQAGTIRVVFQHRRIANGASEVRLLRRRAGASSVSSSASNSTSTFADGSIDLTVQPGDRITLQHRNNPGSSGSEVQNARLTLDPACYLWPVSSFGEYEGNATIT